MAYPNDNTVASRAHQNELNRSEINRALAKALAFKQCGKHYRADQWAARLVELLGAADILTAEARQGARTAALEG